MSVTANRPTERRPPDSDAKQRAVDLVRQLCAAAEGEDIRYAFRELAKEVLDPRGGYELTVCDNDGNVLGFFEPVLARMKKQGHASPPVASVDEFLRGSIPAEEMLKRVFDQTSS